MNEPTVIRSANPSARPLELAGAIALICALILAYADTMGGLAHRWWNESDYQYCFLVPIFAAWLLWARREMFDYGTMRGSWWGLAFFAAGAALRWTSAYFFYTLLDPVSIVPCLAGIVLWVGGWRALRWAWPSIVFLMFMIPLPGALAGQMSLPLQRIGTIAGTFALQTLGIAAADRGNVIMLTENELGVVGACSGLRMLMLFAAVCTGTAFACRRVWWEKAVIVVSSVPIAIAANVGRIIVTGILYETTTAELAETVFHDLAGFFMMPTAILLLWAELALIDKLIIESPKGPLTIGAAGGGLRAVGTTTPSTGRR